MTNVVDYEFVKIDEITQKIQHSLRTHENSFSHSRSILRKPNNCSIACMLVIDRDFKKFLLN